MSCYNASLACSNSDLSVCLSVYHLLLITKKIIERNQNKTPSIFLKQSLNSPSFSQFTVVDSRGEGSTNVPIVSATNIQETWTHNFLLDCLQFTAVSWYFRNSLFFVQLLRFFVCLVATMLKHIENDITHSMHRYCWYCCLLLASRKNNPEGNALLSRGPWEEKQFLNKAASSSSILQ